VNPTILIDGYNLLYGAGIIGEGVDAGTLQNAREALLGWLLQSLPQSDRQRTVVVFDAHHPPPGRPSTFDRQGMTIHFARDHENADALLEDYIAANDAPRQLTVVSSDHRVQRAARRRKATAVDSGAWYRTVDQQQPQRQQDPEAPKPDAPLNEVQVQQWLKFFGENQ
jgi:predicted RNA-binding protein with PIN domain